MTPLLLYALKVGAVLVAALAAVLLLRRRSAALRHWVLVTGVMLGGVMPALQPLAPSWRIALPELTHPEPSRWADLTVPAAPPAPAMDRSTSRGEGLRAAAAWSIVPIWLAGTAVYFGWLLAGVARLSWIERRSTRVTAGPWARAEAELAREYGLPPIPLLQTPHPALLVTWGWLRPRVLLPSGAGGWTEERIRLVLRHELAHVMRADWLTQTLAELLRCLHWYNPIVWVVCRRLRCESEQACDDCVLRAGVDAPAYASELLNVAHAFRRHGRPWSAAPAMARLSTLHGRIHAMLSSDLDRRPLSRQVRVASALVLLSMGVATAGFGTDTAASPSLSPPPPSPSMAAALPAPSIVETAAPASEARPRAPEPALPAASLDAPATAPSAQTGTAALSGVVRDVDGALPGAQVSLRRRTGGTRIEISTVADANGKFELREIPAGQYDFEVRLAGFRAVTRPMELSAEARIHEELMLQVGAVAETIAVVADFNGPAADQLAGERTRAAETIRMAGARDEQPAAPVRDMTVTLPDGQTVTRVGGNIQPPRKIKDVKPVYPASAVAAGAVGVVVLQATIGIDGRVAEVTPLRSPLHPDLTLAATEAVLGWEFTPTRLNGRPVAVEMFVTVSFSGTER